MIFMNTLLLDLLNVKQMCITSPSCRLDTSCEQDGAHIKVSDFMKVICVLQNAFFTRVFKFVCQ
jgi:hypothetical protein